MTNIMHLTHLENDESIDMIESVSGDLWDPIEEYGQEGKSSKTETQEETIISVSQRLTEFFLSETEHFIFSPGMFQKKLLTMMNSIYRKNFKKPEGKYQRLIEILRFARLFLPPNLQKGSFAR